MKKYVAEFIGTLVLTLFGCGSAAISGGIDGALGIFGIAMAFRSFHRCHGLCDRRCFWLPYQPGSIFGSIFE